MSKVIYNLLLVIKVKRLLLLKLVVKFIVTKLILLSILDTAGKDSNKQRVILARFDPNTKDAEYALYICRQTRFYKNNKELKAYFVNAWQSMC